MNTPEFGSVLGGSGGEQEGGETGGDQSVEISGEGKGAGLGRPGMRTRVGGSSGFRASVTCGLEKTPVRGLVEGSRDAFLKSENNGDGGSHWDSHKISHWTYQLQASQPAGDSGTHSGFRESGWQLQRS